MDRLSIYQNSWILSVQTPRTSKKKMSKKPMEAMLVFLLQNPHQITNAQSWGGYTSNLLYITPIYYLQPKKTKSLVFVSQNAKWQIKFKKTTI